LLPFLEQQSVQLAPTLQGQLNGFKVPNEDPRKQDHWMWLADVDLKSTTSRALGQVAGNFWILTSTVWHWHNCIAGTKKYKKRNKDQEVS